MSQDTSLQNELETQVTREESRIVIDTYTANTLHSMGSQSNPQLKLKIKNLAKREYVMNDVDITLEQNAFSNGDDLYDFLYDFNYFRTNPNITYEDISNEDEEKKIGGFLWDIKYNAGVGDKKAKNITQ